MRFTVSILALYVMATIALLIDLSNNDWPEGGALGVILLAAAAGFALMVDRLER